MKVADRDISLSIPSQGQCFGLLGPNGAGKTTLVDILTGKTAMSRGSVEINGAVITVCTISLNISTTAPIHTSYWLEQRWRRVSGRVRVPTARCSSRLDDSGRAHQVLRHVEG